VLGCDTATSASVLARSCYWVIEYLNPSALYIIAISLSTIAWLRGMKRLAYMVRASTLLHHKSDLAITTPPPMQCRDTGSYDLLSTG
jgi:hypothetical protein